MGIGTTYSMDAHLNCCLSGKKVFMVGKATIFCLEGDNAPQIKYTVTQAIPYKAFLKGMSWNGEPTLDLDHVDHMLKGKAPGKVPWSSWKAEDQEMTLCPVILETPNDEKASLSCQGLQWLTVGIRMMLHNAYSVQPCFTGKLYKVVGMNI